MAFAMWGHSATDGRETFSRPENPSRKPAQPSHSPGNQSDLRTALSAPRRGVAYRSLGRRDSSGPRLNLVGQAWRTKTVSYTETGKSLCDAGALTGPPAYATERPGSLNDANGTPTIRIARNGCNAESAVSTDDLDHVRWYHAKVDWTAAGGIYSVSGDGIDPRVALQRWTGSASRGTGPHPGETGGAPLVYAAAGGAKASEGGRFASGLITMEAIR